MALQKCETAGLMIFWINFLHRRQNRQYDLWNDLHFALGP